MTKLNTNIEYGQFYYTAEWDFVTRVRIENIYRIMEGIVYVHSKDMGCSFEKETSTLFKTKKEAQVYFDTDHVIPNYINNNNSSTFDETPEDKQITSAERFDAGFDGVTEPSDYSSYEN